MLPYTKLEASVINLIGSLRSKCRNVGAVVKAFFKALKEPYTPIG